MLTFFFLCQISTTKQHCVTYETSFHIIATQFPNQNPPRTRHTNPSWTHQAPWRWRQRVSLRFLSLVLFSCHCWIWICWGFFCYLDYWWVFVTIELLSSSWSKSLTIVGNLEWTRWKGFVGDETKRFGFQQVYLE